MEDFLKEDSFEITWKHVRGTILFFVCTFASILIASRNDALRKYRKIKPTLTALK